MTQEPYAAGRIAYRNGADGEKPPYHHLFHRREWVWGWDDAHDFWEGRPDPFDDSRAVDRKATRQGPQNYRGRYGGHG